MGTKTGRQRETTMPRIAVYITRDRRFIFLSALVHMRRTSHAHGMALVLLLEAGELD
jgi:hypothetical protein